MARGGVVEACNMGSCITMISANLARPTYGVWLLEICILTLPIKEFRRVKGAH